MVDQDLEKLFAQYIINSLVRVMDSWVHNAGHLSHKHEVFSIPTDRASTSCIVSNYFSVIYSKDLTNYLSSLEYFVLS